MHNFKFKKKNTRKLKKNNNIKIQKERTHAKHENYSKKNYKIN